MDRVMPADETFRIAYLGPSMGGKSMLLTSITDCTALELHGYPPALAPRIVRVDPEAREETRVPGQGGVDDLLERYKKIITRPRDVRAFISDVDHTRGGAGISATNVVQELFGRLTYEQDDGTRTKLFHVFDSPGERFFERGHGGEVDEEVADEQKREILRHLSQAEALVVAVAFSQLSNAAVSDGLNAILTFLAEERHGPMREKGFRVVIALTRYDALFLRFGSLAFAAASEPDVAAMAIGKALRPCREAYEALRKLDISDPDGCFDIRLAPTSAFGFLPRFGCPNIDPSVRDEPQVRRGLSPNLFLDEGRARTVFPFLTADPFIFAVTGIASDFFVRLPDALALADDAAKLGRDEVESTGGEAEAGPEPVPREAAAAPFGASDGTAAAAPRREERPQKARERSNTYVEAVAGRLWQGIRSVGRDLLR
jgi:hypothetical protein